MKVKAFLFDCDGTVINTNRLVLNSWRTATNFFLPGKPVTDYDIKKYYGQPLEESATLLAEEFGVTDYDLKEIADVYWTYHGSHHCDIDGLFPTVEGALRALKEKGAKIGIVTSGLSANCSKELEGLGVRELFDAIVGADDVTEPKPSPQPALICCQKLGVAPEDAMMIGDSKHDISCGNSAGCHTAMVGWTECILENLEESQKADITLTDANQLLEYI